MPRGVALYAFLLPASFERLEPQLTAFVGNLKVKTLLGNRVPSLPTPLMVPAMVLADVILLVLLLAVQHGEPPHLPSC